MAPVTALYEAQKGLLVTFQNFTPLTTISIVARCRGYRMLTLSFAMHENTGLLVGSCQSEPSLLPVQLALSSLVCHRLCIRDSSLCVSVPASPPWVSYDDAPSSATFSLSGVSALVGAFSWGITLSNGATSLWDATPSLAISQSTVRSFCWSPAAPFTCWI